MGGARLDRKGHAKILARAIEDLGLTDGIMRYAKNFGLARTTAYNRYRNLKPELEKLGHHAAPLRPRTQPNLILTKDGAVKASPIVHRYLKIRENNVGMAAAVEMIAAERTMEPMRVRYELRAAGFDIPKMRTAKGQPRVVTNRAPAKANPILPAPVTAPRSREGCPRCGVRPPHPCPHGWNGEYYERPAR